MIRVFTPLWLAEPNRRERQAQQLVGEDGERGSTENPEQAQGEQLARLCTPYPRWQQAGATDRHAAPGEGATIDEIAEALS
jgi:hypothetical protein